MGRDEKGLKAMLLVFLIALVMLISTAVEVPTI